MSGAANTYQFGGVLSYAVHSYTTASKYVLYDDGAFALQYPDSPPGSYVGTYRQDAGRISFSFSGGGDATGTLNGDSLEVRYNVNMQLSDFENAVYTRVQ